MMILYKEQIQISIVQIRICPRDGTSGQRDNCRRNRASQIKASGNTGFAQQSELHTLSVRMGI